MTRANTSKAWRTSVAEANRAKIELMKHRSNVLVREMFMRTYIRYELL